MILLGAIVNGAAVIIGGTLGCLLKKGLPERYGSLLVTALSLFTFALGIRFAVASNDLMVVVFSLVLGALLGERIDIEKRMDDLGNWAQNKLKGQHGNFSQGFVTASLLFCVGSMAIMGSLQSGLSGKHEILFTKAIMDGIISVVFASTMGIGVVASAIPLFFYQGSISMLASVVSPLLSTAVVTEMTATGGILLIGIAISMLELRKIKVGNLLPAIFLPILLMPLFEMLALWLK